MTTDTQVEANASVLGQGLMQHLKAYIQLFVSEQADLQDVDIAALSAKVTEIQNITDGDPESDGYQAFQGLLDDVALLKTDNTTNKSRLTAVEAALNTMDAAWKAEVARVETESQARDTALGLRVDGVEAAAAAAAAARLSKDNEHDGKIATLEATAGNLEDAIIAEVQRAVAKEVELQASINGNTAEINAIKGRESNYSTHAGLDNSLVALCSGAATELWAGRTMPDGLPTFSTVE